MNDGAVEIRRSHVPGLDGLRAVAVAAVVAYHLGLLPGGFVGVDLFFVLSGFLITSLLLLRTPTGLTDLRRWWGRRVRRLTPAVTVVVLAVLVSFSAIGAASDSLDVDAVATLTWWQNWHLILADVSYWARQVSPLRHAWSLSIEEQFYLVWPVVLLAAVGVARRTSRNANRIVVAVASAGTLASFAWAAHLAGAGADLSRIYFGTDTRVGALLLGCAAAAVVDGRDTPTMGRRGALAAGAAAVVLIVLAVVLDPSEAATYLWGLPVAAIASLVMVLTAAFSAPVERALSAAALQWVGVRSYGIYLWSWPVQVFIEERWPDSPRWLVTLVTVTVAVALADVSLRLIESPLRLGTGWAQSARKRGAAWVTGAAAVVIAVTAVMVTATGPTGFQAVSTEESAAAALRPPPTTTSDPTAGASTPASSVDPQAGEAAVGEPPGEQPLPLPEQTTTTAAPQRLRLAVFGDSVAFSSTFVSGPLQLHPAGIEIADGRGFIGCWLLSGDGWKAYEDTVLKRPHPLCAKQREAEQLALSAHPDWVVHFAGGWEGTTFIDPSGVRHRPQTPAVRQAILEELIQRGTEANAAGARIAWPVWACPGPESPLWFADGYAGWFNQILREASVAVPGSIVIEATDRVCVNADPDGVPTEEKDIAWGREHHPHDGAWLWQVWIGPALWAAEGQPNPG